MPFHFEGGDVFVRELAGVLQRVQVPNVSDAVLTRLQDLDPAEYRASWNVFATERMIDSFYEELLAL